jgi:hypothetical protein
MGHLKGRGLNIEKSGAGIYTVEGESIPVQIIKSRELPVGENGWLRGLGPNLKAEDVSWFQNRLFCHQLLRFLRLKPYETAFSRLQFQNLTFWNCLTY